MAEPAAQADAIEKIVSEKLYLDLKADHSVLISKYKDLLSESDKIQKKAQNNHTLYMVTKGQLEIVQDRLAQALYGKGASSPLDDNNLNDNGEDDDDNELTELLKEETSSDNTTSSEPVNSGENLVH